MYSYSKKEFTLLRIIQVHVHLGYMIPVISFVSYFDRNIHWCVGSVVINVLAFCCCVLAIGSGCMLKSMAVAHLDM